MEKTKLTDEQKNTMRKLFEDNGLSKDDVFTHKHYVIIKRSGIEKIQYNNGIKVTYDLVRCEEGWAAVKAIGKQGSLQVETYGSATPKNSSNFYFLEMAEKRALSRVVLKMCKMYEMNVFGEDEEMHKNG